MKTYHKRKKRGFTLIELTIAMGIGIMTSSMLLVLFNQQTTFLNIYNRQNFITTEAPMINLFVSRLVGKSDSYRIFNSLNDANQDVSSPNLVNNTGKFISLDFRNPDGTVKTAILAFRGANIDPNETARNGLNYYIRGPWDPGSSTYGPLVAPDWTISTKPTDISFSLNRGILVMTVTGPAGEIITYSGSAQS
jgi:type II secretory pathway pseudopilin PulG